ncbi:MAG: Precorrin-3B methylase [Spirochaetota bacterium]
MTGADRGELTGEALVKETTRLIRLARSHWDAHENAACRAERDRALFLYARLLPEEKKKIPQVLLVWLRYRSEKYFGAERTAPGTAGRPPKQKRAGPARPRRPKG